MNQRNNRDQKAALALAIAAGGTIKAWAKEHDVAQRTAYTWARSPDVKKQVRHIRRRAIDRVIGRLSRHAAAAADRIAHLAQGAASESVQLQAARAVLSDLMSVSNYAALEERLTEVERRIADRQAAEPGLPQLAG
jgi:hypothetical protein